MESEKNDALVPEEQLNKDVEDISNATPTAKEESVEEGIIEESKGVDFTEEEAMLAADEIDLGDDEEAEDTAHVVVDYSGHSLKELIAALEGIVASGSEAPRREIEAIKIAFYKKTRAEIEAAKAEFVKAGGDEAEFKAPSFEEEQRLKDLIFAYKNAKFLKNKEVEAEKEKNYKEKLQILEDLKVLSEGSEAHNHTYQEFKNLQIRWKEIGQVPQSHVKDLWDNYHYLVEKFYDYIKINRELRDLDLKKNYEAKILLCEKSEELLLEPSPILAFQKLQKLHEQWREVGPVAKEFKEVLWDRFKEATSKINKKHQEYYDLQKEDQKKNLDTKTLLCEKAEELLSGDQKTTKDWNKKSKDLIELQKVWKTVGFAPKKENAKIYQRFREACDAFFEKKREFYVQLKAQIDVNLQAKLALCEKAEAISASSEWKKATDELIALQKQWKEVGPVPRKHSDEVWKRFRAACDSFFNRKSEHFSDIDKQYEGNLKEKEALIEEIRAFVPVEDVTENFEILKNFQRRWAEIGFVPMRDKERIQSAYREVIDAQFQKIKGTDADRKIGKFKGWVESNTGRGDKKFRAERDKLIGKIRQLESDISVWENNIGFFAKSKNADAMINEVQNKIKKAKEEIALVEEKINLIDSQLPE